MKRSIESCHEGEHITKRQKKNNVEISAYELAQFYQKRGNTRLAFKWLKKSAQDGNIDARRELGNCYFFGKEGCDRDVHEAMRWFKACKPTASFKNLASIKTEITYGEIYEFEETIEKLQEENASLKETIAELEITVPIEGGSEYQAAKRRFDEYKKLKT